MHSELYFVDAFWPAFRKLPGYEVFNVAYVHAWPNVASGSLETRIGVRNLFDKVYLLRDGSGVGLVRLNTENGRRGLLRCRMRFDLGDTGSVAWHRAVVVATICAAVVTGCASAPAGNAVRAYVTEAERWTAICLDSAADVERSSGDRPVSARQCSDEAMAAVQPLRAAAEAEVFMQRLPSRRLAEFTARWQEAMLGVAQDSPTGASPESRSRQRAEIFELGARMLQ